MDTDPDRCGVLKAAFDEDFNFLKYINFALSVPMYFVKREGKYIDCSGSSFNDFFKGELVQLPGEKPTISDWEDHLSTIFTEVRLKSYIEVRSLDACEWDCHCAGPAFFIGLLYGNLDETYEIIKKWSKKNILEAYFSSPSKGFNLSLIHI